MKMNKLFLLTAALLAVTACHGQVPPTTHQVALSWTAPSSCTTASPCTFVLSRAAITGATCPAATGTAYTPLNQTTPASGSTYTDTTASGLNGCYIAQTLQTGAVSLPSNVVGPLTVAANPLAPALNANPTVSTNAPVMIPQTRQMVATGKALNAPFQLQARVQ